MNIVPILFIAGAAAVCAWWGLHNEGMIRVYFLAAAACYVCACLVFANGLIPHAFVVAMLGLVLSSIGEAKRKSAGHK